MPIISCLKCDNDVFEFDDRELTSSISGKKFNVKINCFACFECKTPDFNRSQLSEYDGLLEKNLDEIKNG